MIGLQLMLHMKPEDYQKIERLAKRNGCKSVSDYIQKLVDMDLKRCKE